MTPTNTRKALVVIDMQNDYLWPSRKPMFNYDTEDLVSHVNGAIARFSGAGHDVIYIEQIFPDIVTNRWFIGFSIRGTDGAKTYEGVKRVEGKVFEKNLPDTYTAKAFREHMAREGYGEVVLCGLDECGCVGATAQGAARTGARVVMLEDCIGRRFPEAKVQKMRKKLAALGVTYQMSELYPI
ncbi:Nicotinamidase-related amidase [Ruminococcaceae bacterium YRB3002]|nr:Nicotinamidase-related amidase [Ruminococcaceae bacterium YRB3002]